jgi:DNA primase
MVEHIGTLQTQNDEFRKIIKQMRAELELLSDSRGEPTAENMPTVGYVCYMEGEVRRLKAHNREIVEQQQQQQQQQQAVPQGKPPTPNTRKTSTLAEKKQHSPVSSSPEQHRNHLIALSETIASLHRERTEMENKEREVRRNLELLQDRLKEEQELVSLPR